MAFEQKFFLESFIELRPKKSAYSIFLIVASYSPSKNLPKKTKKVGATMQKKYEHSWFFIKFNKTLPLYISSIEFLKMVFETPCSFVTLADVSHFAFDWLVLAQKCMTKTKNDWNQPIPMKLSRIRATKIFKIITAAVNHHVIKYNCAQGLISSRKTWRKTCQLFTTRRSQRRTIAEKKSSKLLLK